MDIEKINHQLYSETLNEPLYETKNINGVTHRQLHNWMQSEVIEDKRDPDALRRWNYYSPIDIIWIGIVKQLRAMHLSLVETKAIKDYVFEKIENNTDTALYPALEVYSTYVLLYNQPIYIVITYKEKLDSIWMLDEKDYFLKLKDGGFKNHLIISLHDIVKTNLEPIYDIVEFCKLTGLTKEESEILESIRNSSFQTIKITKKDDNVQILESIEKIKDVKQIEKLIIDGDYKNMEVKKLNGKIVVAYRTFRKNL